MMPASSGRDNGRIASASTSQRWRQNRSYAIALLDEWRYFFAQRSDGCVASVRLAHRAPHDSTNACSLSGATASTTAPLPRVAWTACRTAVPGRSATKATSLTVSARINGGSGFGSVSSAVAEPTGDSRASTCWYFTYHGTMVPKYR